MGRFVCPCVAAPGHAPEVSGNTQTGYFLLNTQKVDVEKGSGGLGEQMWRCRVFSLASLLNNWIFPVGEEGCASKPVS